MKLIHCADLHLDARMRTHLTAEQAKERKAELLETFARMVRYGADEGVKAILIAGDLFDTTRISAHARNFVADTIRSYEDITFFYLRGNHDSDGFLESLDTIPENLKLFSTEWTRYTVEEDGQQVTICGVELTEGDENRLFHSLLLQPSETNIVMLHGQISEYAGKENAEIVDLSALKNKNIQYLALGHVHEYQSGPLAPAGTYCYSGCLEGRGFDECGTKGFVLLEISEGLQAEITSTFVPFAYRTLYDVPVDMTDVFTSAQACERVEEVLSESPCRPMDLVKVTLTGSVEYDSEISIEQIEQRFAGRYYLFRVKNETHLKVDYETFRADASLKGEFVRLVAEQDLPEETKAAIIRCGIQALYGEEIAL